MDFSQHDFSFTYIKKCTLLEFQLLTKVIAERKFLKKEQFIKTQYRTEKSIR